MGYSPYMGVILLKSGSEPDTNQKRRRSEPERLKKSWLCALRDPQIWGMGGTRFGVVENHPGCSLATSLLQLPIGVRLFEGASWTHLGATLDLPAGSLTATRCRQDTFQGYWELMLRTVPKVYAAQHGLAEQPSGRSA